MNVKSSCVWVYLLVHDCVCVRARVCAHARVRLCTCVFAPCCGNGAHTLPARHIAWRGMALRPVLEILYEERYIEDIATKGGAMQVGRLILRSTYPYSAVRVDSVVCVDSAVRETKSHAYCLLPVRPSSLACISVI